METFFKHKVYKTGIYRRLVCNFLRNNTFYGTGRRLLEEALYKKWGLPLKISSANVAKIRSFRSFLWIWSHLLKKSLMESFIFYAMKINILLRFFLTTLCFEDSWTVVHRCSIKKLYQKSPTFYWKKFAVESFSSKVAVDFTCLLIKLEGEIFQNNYSIDCLQKQSFGGVL